MGKFLFLCASVIALPWGSAEDFSGCNQFLTEASMSVSDSRSEKSGTTETKTIAIRDFTNPDIFQLLQMAGQLRNHEDGGKDVFKKKEFRLGQMLDDGYSIELQYNIDSRLDEVVYRLSKAERIDSNGKVEPLTILTDEQGEEVQNLIIHAPRVLTGEILKEYLNWGERFRFLKATQLREISTKRDLLKLKTEFLLRDHRELYGSRFRKAYPKMLTMVMIVMAFNYGPQIMGIRDDAKGAMSTPLVSAALPNMLQRHFESGKILKKDEFRQLVQFEKPSLTFVMDDGKAIYHVQYFARSEAMVITKHPFSVGVEIKQKGGLDMGFAEHDQQILLKRSDSPEVFDLIALSVRSNP